MLITLISIENRIVSKVKIPHTWKLSDCQLVQLLAATFFFFFFGGLFTILA